ncbi:ABC transporter permease [bacterium]|nr:ABC transporter permease [bacterium]
MGFFNRFGSFCESCTAGFGRRAFRNLGGFATSVWEGLTPPLRPYWGEIIDFASHSGVNAIGIVAVTSTVAGVTSSYLLAEQVKRFGVGAELMGGAVTHMLVDQLVPILVGLVVAGRTGSAITATIGTMRVTEQVEALKSLNTDPIQFLLFPRLWAMVLMVPALTVLACVVANITAFVAANNIIHISFGTWKLSILSIFDLETLYEAIIKSAVFGVIISLVSFYQGWAVYQGSAELSRRIQIGVVGSMNLLLIANLLMTIWM